MLLFANINLVYLMPLGNVSFAALRTVYLLMFHDSPEDFHNTFVIYLDNSWNPRQESPMGNIGCFFNATSSSIVDVTETTHAYKKCLAPRTTALFCHLPLWKLIQILFPANFSFQDSWSCFPATFFRYKFLEPLRDVLEKRYSANFSQISEKYLWKSSLFTKILGCWPETYTR